MTSVKPAYDNYDDPSEIVVAKSLSTEEKYNLLTQWREDEEALMRSSSEGLTGGERPELRRVQMALQTLEKSQPQITRDNLKRSLEDANFETMAHHAKAALGGPS